MSIFNGYPQTTGTDIFVNEYNRLNDHLGVILFSKLLKPKKFK